ncbi:hypothetical protein [Streptomyces sp. WMMC940]|uniref:hypothetical protein n=1 Tax=Streptomyces sp. WMMC940 TaxID=3015153 RepID=UPI0022B6F275|nr:hypothetical protein [Streptomyces sp. WMMC940]MCZ7462264.1 hypothetical protein [Streptomyces sp. WMMC940]
MSPGTATPAPAPTTSDRRSVEADPAKLPRTASAATELIGAALAAPEEFGHGVVRSAPHERDPGWWPVLAENCVWQRAGLPAGVLASRTRDYELPADGGKGAVRLTATVTVYRTTHAADWANAETLEETMRCPDQRLGQRERLKAVFSQAHYFGEGQNSYAEDSLLERGGYLRDGQGGPYPYMWWQARIGPVQVSAAVKGAKGHSEQETTGLLVNPMVQMIARVKARIGTTAQQGTASPREQETKGRDVNGQGARS